MVSRPLVSVVMAVFNGGARLGATLDSLLEQQGCDFEIIVVDDGSTDDTASILARYAARDERVRVFRRDNAGLTLSLIFGCAQAIGEYIARQDADDLSLPDRLHVQSSYLLAHPEVVIVASAVRFVAPEGEWLHSVTPPASISIQLDIDRIRAPPLVGAMFRRDAYLRCGGFQKEMVVAQDVDLWLRLEEVGACHGIADLHYEGRMTLGGITSRRRHTQMAATRLAISCALARRAGKTDSALLQSAAFPARSTGGTPRLARARFNYFIACCLRRNDRAASRRYLRRVLHDNPFHVKALYRWLVG